MRGQEGVGVFDGNGNCLHMAPPPDRVPALMGDQFNSMRDAKERLNMSVTEIRNHYFELQRRFYSA